MTQEDTKVEADVTDSQWASAQARGWLGTRDAYAVWRVVKDAYDEAYAAWPDDPTGAVIAARETIETRRADWRDKHPR